MSKKSHSNKKRKRGAIQLAREQENVLIEELIRFGKAYPTTPGLNHLSCEVAPPAVRVVLSYGFNTSNATVSGELDTWLFRGNGMFDPDVTGVGSQPLGFDQWHTFYARNRVIASSIEFVATTPNSTSDSQREYEVCVVPTNTTSAPVSMGACRAMPYAQAKTITGAIPNGNRFRRSMETSRITGKTQSAVLIDDNLAGANGSDPADVWYWLIQTQPTDTTAAANVHLTGTIHYLVDFWDRNLYALSVQLPAFTTEEQYRVLLAKKKKRSSVTLKK